MSPTTTEPPLGRMPKLPDARLSANVAPHADTSRPTPWWLWPHLWSLDAPAVAISWQLWWSHAAKVELTWRHGLILGGAVWMIYLADRVADVWQTNHFEHGTARHAFYHGRRRAALCGVLGLAFALGLVTLNWLSAREFCAGLCMLALAAGYFLLTHRQHYRAWMAILPKEGAVGGLFALGTMTFVWCRLEHIDGPLRFACLLAATLFFLNCAFISRWELSERDCLDPFALRNAFPGFIRRLGASSAVLAAVALGLMAVLRTGIFLPIAASAGLLWLLDRRRAQLSTDALRILADAALLSPWCFLFLATSS